MSDDDPQTLTEVFMLAEAQARLERLRTPQGLAACVLECAAQEWSDEPEAKWFEFLETLREQVCFDCGGPQPANGIGCQCWNDE